MAKKKKYLYKDPIRYKAIEEYEAKNKDAYEDMINSLAKIIVAKLKKMAK